MATKKVVPKKNEPSGRFGSGFMHFIRTYGVIPLAIAVVLGNAINDVVKSLVDGLITPFISLVVPSTSLQEYSYTVGKSTFAIGSVLSALLSFVIIAAIIYVFVKKILRDDSALEKKG